MKITKILFGLLLAALVVSCCPCKKYQKQYGKPLVGTQWGLVQLNGQQFSNGGKYNFTLTDQNTLSGVGDCNRLMGKYTADKQGAFKVENMASTRMMCPNQQGEDDFMKLLQSVDAYKLDGPMLMLLKDGELVAIFEANKVMQNEDQQ